MPELTQLEAIYLQADNNDAYLVEGSVDGERFFEVWEAAKAGGSGLRPRHTKDLSAEVKVLRLSAKDGDGLASVSEFMVFETTPSRWPPRLPIAFDWTANETAKLLVGLFAIFCALTTLLHRRRGALSRGAWLATWALGTGPLWAVYAAWPANIDVVNLGRATAALLALGAVGRLWLDRPDTSERAVTGVLAIAAVIGVVAFYNFGQPQFRNAAERTKTYVHTFDTRVYYPAAKYAKELGYDGVYVASVKALADEKYDGSIASLASTPIRDLRDYRMTTVGALSEQIENVPARFTEARWHEFKRDMAFFWETMSVRDYLGSLRDHGGNATPAWLWLTHLMFSPTQASEATLLWAALLDPLLLLLFFIVAWRTFNLRTALLCIAVYGATTFPMFGSNWGGATLRNDWMVLLGLGVCALAAGRWVFAGVLLGLSAMIRAFPALALFFLVIPLLWWLVERRRGGQPLSIGALWSAARPLWLTAVGAIGCALVLTAASSATFGFDKSWGQWSRKISMHADKPNVNHVGLRTVLTYDPDRSFPAIAKRGEPSSRWVPLQLQTLEERKWGLRAVMALFTVLAFLACGVGQWHIAALLGSMMFPMYLYPSNYYLHCIFVLPLLAPWGSAPRQRQRFFIVGALVCVLCLAQYFGWFIPGHYGRFMLSSVLLLVIYPLIWIGLWRRPKLQKAGV